MKYRYISTATDVLWVSVTQSWGGWVPQPNDIKLIETRKIVQVIDTVGVSSELLAVITIDQIACRNDDSKHSYK